MKRWLDLIIPGLLLLAAVLVRMNEPAQVEQMRNLVFDQYQRLKPREYTPQPIKIIDIDEESLRRLGQWPWPRHVLARLVDRLAESGVARRSFKPSTVVPRRAIWPAIRLRSKLGSMTSQAGTKRSATCPLS